MENSESARFESRGCRHTYTEHTHGIPAIRYGQVRHGRKTRNAASTMRSDAPSAPSSRPITHSVCPRKSFDGEPKKKKKKKTISPSSWTAAFITRPACHANAKGGLARCESQPLTEINRDIARYRRKHTGMKFSCPFTDVSSPAGRIRSRLLLPNIRVAPTSRRFNNTLPLKYPFLFKNNRFLTIHFGNIRT